MISRRSSVHFPTKQDISFHYFQFMDQQTVNSDQLTEIRASGKFWSPWMLLNCVCFFSDKSSWVIKRILLTYQNVLATLIKNGWNVKTFKTTKSNSIVDVFHFFHKSSLDLSSHEFWFRLSESVSTLRHLLEIGGPHRLGGWPTTIWHLCVWLSIV